MTYSEAVRVIAEETGEAHEEGCFETGNCDPEHKAGVARRKLHAEHYGQDGYHDRLARIQAAKKIIQAHLEQYDREQIVPSQTSPSDAAK